MSTPTPPPVGTTATRTAPDGTLWRRLVTKVGQHARLNVNYTLTGPEGDVFEMYCPADVWREDVADCTLGHTDGPPAPRTPPRTYTWDELIALAMSVPKAEWRRDRDNTSAHLGSAYAPLYLDLGPGPTLQVGSGPRGYTFRDTCLTRTQRDDLRRLSDHVFAPGHDVEAKLAYVFGGDFPR